MKLVLPSKNVTIKGEKSFTDSVRLTVYNFFNSEGEKGDTMLKTIKWFLYQEYAKPIDEYYLANCPICHNTNIKIKRADIKENFTFKCPKCLGRLYMTDVFRLHEAIDDALRADHARTGQSSVVAGRTAAAVRLFRLRNVRRSGRCEPDTGQRASRDARNSAALRAAEQ